MTSTKALVFIAMLVVTASCGPFDKLGQTLGRLREIPRAAGDMAHKAAESSGRLANDVAQGTKKAFEDTKAKAEDVLQKAKDMAEEAVSKPVNKVKDAVGGAAHKLEDKITEEKNKVGDALAKAGHTITDVVESIKKLQESLMKQFVALFEIFNDAKKMNETLNIFKEEAQKHEDAETRKVDTPPLDIPEKDKTPSTQQAPPTKQTDDATKQEQPGPLANREVEGTMSGSNGLIRKLAHPTIRASVVRGFFKKQDSDMQTCHQVYEEVSSLVPSIVQLMTASSSQEAIMLALSTKMKLESVTQRMTNDERYASCFNVQETRLKHFMIKFMMDPDTLVEEAKENTEIWTLISSGFSEFQGGAYEAAGATLAKAILVASNLKVSLDEAKINDIDFWSCFNTIVKAKMSQPITDDYMADWRRAALESKDICFATAH